MKKFLFIIFTLALCLFIMSFEKQSVSASTDNKGDLISSEIQYLDDGSFLVTKHYNLSENYISRSNTRTVFHTVTVTQYSASEKVLWEYTITGGWYVNDGISVMAMSSVLDYVINNNTWHYSDGESTYYDNIVHGGAVFTHKLLGVAIKTVTIDINMVCDLYGNVTRI